MATGSKNKIAFQRKAGDSYDELAVAGTGKDVVSTASA
jgi:hypothetical protein